MPATSDDHVHVGYQDFGLRPRVRALCSCGHQTFPRDNADAALIDLVEDHGARTREPGESVGISYLPESR